MSSYFEPDAAGPIITNGTTKVSVIRPLLALPALPVANVAAWVMGAWVVIAAANDLAAHMLIALDIWQTSGANDWFQIDIGTGAAGAEVVVARATFFRDAQAGGGLMSHVPIIPFVTIPTNARVATRCASNAGGGIPEVYATFIPRPVT